MHQLEAQIFYLFWFIPISPGIVLPWVITLLIGGVVYLGSRQLTLVPGRFQSALEMVVEELGNFLGTLLGGKHGKEYVPFFSTVFLYLFVSNVLGLIPGLKSPTSIFSNCLGMALIIFIMVHYQGFKKGGLHYLKHFWGDPWWLGPLMLPIHLVGEISRPISLTLRLFGNIMGEDIVILVLTIAIFPFLVPIPMLFLALFTSLIQALVFTILSCIYLSGAVSSEEH